MKRQSIYIPNEEIWQEIQQAAKEANRSVSNYLITLHKQEEARKHDKEV